MPFVSDFDVVFALMRRLPELAVEVPVVNRLLFAIAFIDDDSLRDVVHKWLLMGFTKFLTMTIQSADHEHATLGVILVLPAQISYFQELLLPFLSRLYIQHMLQVFG